MDSKTDMGSSQQQGYRDHSSSTSLRRAAASPMKLFKDEEKSVEWRYRGARNADSTQNLHIYHFKRFLSNYGSFKSFGSMEISKWCQFLKLYQTNGIMQRQQHRHRKIGLSLTIGQFLAWFLWKHSIIWPNFGISLIKMKSFHCTTFSRKKFEFPIDLQIS